MLDYFTLDGVKYGLWRIAASLLITSLFHRVCLMTSHILEGKMEQQCTVR